MTGLLLLAAGAAVVWLFVRGWSRPHEILWMAAASSLLGVSWGLVDDRSLGGTLVAGLSTAFVATAGFSLGRSERETRVDRVVSAFIADGRVHSPTLLLITDWVAGITFVVGALVLPGIWALRPDLFGAAAIVVGALVGVTLLLILALWMRGSRSRSGPGP